MLFNVTWSCVNCKNRASYKEVDFRVISYDPGACLVRIWSHFLHAKREIKICTLCRECIENDTEEEQTRVIYTLADQLNSIRGVVHWKNCELQWRCPIAKVEEITTKIAMGEKLELHQFCTARLA